jgi:hypothetical protein
MAADEGGDVATHEGLEAVFEGAWLDVLLGCEVVMLLSEGRVTWRRGKLMMTWLTNRVSMPLRFPHCLSICLLPLC